MTIPYRDILLWGHSFDDYQRMFALSEADLKLNLLDCGGGPSSFNAILSERGGKVISCDNLFALSKIELKKQIAENFADMIITIEQNKDRFLWDEIFSPEELAKLRLQQIEIFLDDYETGIKQGRYIADTPPHLKFKHYEFDLALCSHYFFANCQDQSVDFHVAAIKNLTDVAKEVRIFPLLDTKGQIPEIVGLVTQGLHQASLGVEIKAVPYQFQTKGNAMLRVWAQVCEV